MHLRSAVLGVACLCLVILVSSALHCKTTTKGQEYTGEVAKTKTGKTCQAWASQSPHSHKIFTYPDGSEEAASNFCRNPDGVDGPWCYTTDPNTRWEYCDVAPCAECKRSALGTEYTGTASQTASGLKCQAWASQTPHNHNVWSENLPEGSEEEAKNYCRNPDKVSGGPWCYTTDPNTRWEYCGVKFCDECKKTALGKDYLGHLSQTVSGRTCQPWASQSPHKHDVWESFPDGAEEDAANYCRNPDNTDGGPWCYTTDPGQRWEFCDVKFCECKTTKLGTEYQGQVSKTVSGRVCQYWSSQAPQSHKVFDNLPDGSQEAAKNYCRNPDDQSNGPWCYTTDPNTRWENCDVPLC